MDTRQVFNVRLVIGLVAAGILAFVAFLVLSTYAGDFRAGRDGRTHALSISAVGFKGLVDLVGYAGGTARFVRSEGDLDTEDLLVIVLEPDADADKVAGLLEARTAKPTLIILPKWVTAADPAHPGWVKRVAAFSSVPEGLANVAKIEVKIVDVPKRTIARGADLLDGVQAAAPAKSQIISGEDVVPLIQLPRGGALLARIGGRPLFVLAEPDLMSNYGLKDARTARAALEILDALNSTGAQGIAFDLTLNGFGRKPDALCLAFEPPFVALTIALFAAALLAVWHGAIRFGPMIEDARAIAFGKAALVENSAGLIRMARRETSAGPAYADLVRDEAARVAAAPASLQDEALEAYLDRISPAGFPTFTALAAAVRAAQDRLTLAAAARDLFLWKKELVQ